MKKGGSLTFKELEIEGYERVLEVRDEHAGLHACMAMHNTALGPALGGVRVYPYASFEAALEDALRLAKGMTYKAALAMTGTGGGKSVIIADNRKPKSHKMLHAFAEAVNQFSGQYICAEDLGMTLPDMEVLRERTRYLVGFLGRGSSGDPSPFTAFGVYQGVLAVGHTLFGANHVKGKRVAIQGLGHVGMKLANFLFWQGADLVVTDVNGEMLEKAQRLYAAEVVGPDEIYDVDADIFAPCALGGVLNEDTIARLQCQGVAGAANNQLLTPADGQRLMDRGILYAPDYIVNSGGLINVTSEIDPEGYSPKVTHPRVERIFEQLLEIFETSKLEGKAPSRVADDIAEMRVAKRIGKRTVPPVFHH